MRHLWKKGCSKHRHLSFKQENVTFYDFPASFTNRTGWLTSKLADLAANELPRMVPMSSHLLVSSTQYSQHGAWSKSRTQDQNLVDWSIFNSKSLLYQLPNSEHCCCSCPSWASTPEATRPRKIAQPLDPHLHPPRESQTGRPHTATGHHIVHTWSKSSGLVSSNPSLSSSIGTILQ